jgi:AcrR family transcriptional regulator
MTSSPSTGARVRRSQEQRSAEMRGRLLDATIDCLVQYGYAGTTTPRVAETAGVTRGAQVHHFGSKNELVVAAVKHLAARRTAAAVREIDDLTALSDPVAGLLDLLWEIHDGPLFIATVELWVAGRTDPALRPEVARFETIVVRNLIATVAQAVPEELARPLLDFAYTAMDALRGILTSSFVDDDLSRARRRWNRACVNLRRMADPRLAALADRAR